MVLRARGQIENRKGSGGRVGNINSPRIGSSVMQEGFKHKEYKCLECLQDVFCKKPKQKTYQVKMRRNVQDIHLFSFSVINVYNNCVW